MGLMMKIALMIATSPTLLQLVLVGLHSVSLPLLCYIKFATAHGMDILLGL